MSSNIDPTYPTSGTATTKSVRDNFGYAKVEIEALQGKPPIEDSSYSVGDVILNYNLFAESPTHLHEDVIDSAVSIMYEPTGSGVISGEVNSVTSADMGLYIGCIKKNWDNNPVSGEVDGINVIMRNGGQSDGTCYMANLTYNSIQSGGNYKSYGSLFEGVIQLTRDNDPTVLYQMNCYTGSIGDNTGTTPYVIGYSTTATVGACNAGFQVYGTTTLNKFGIGFAAAGYVDTAFYAGGTHNIGFQCYGTLSQGIYMVGATIANSAIALDDSHKISWDGGAYISGHTSIFINGHLEMENENPIYFRNVNSTAFINAMYLDTSDNLLIGNGLDTYKVINMQTNTYFTKSAYFGTYNNSSPLEGQLWYDGTHLTFRIGSTNYQIDQQNAPSGYLLIADIDDTPVNSETAAPISSNWAYDHVAASDPHTGYVLESEVDDTPVDGVTAAPISSNWAYDHVAAADPHTGYRLESADHTHATTGLQGGTIDHGALTGKSDDDHTQYLLRQPTENIVLNDSAGNFDYRIESVNCQNMFIIDAGADTVLVGTNTDIGATLGIIARATTDYSLGIRALNSQTGNLMRCEDSSGNQLFSITIDGSMEMLKPIYWKNAAGTFKNMIYLSSSDQLCVGAELGSGKLLVNIDGSLKTLSIDGSGFVKAA